MGRTWLNRGTRNPSCDRLRVEYVALSIVNNVGSVGEGNLPLVGSILGSGGQELDAVGSITFSIVKSDDGWLTCGTQNPPCEQDTSRLAM